MGLVHDREPAEILQGAHRGAAGQGPTQTEGAIEGAVLGHTHHAQRSLLRFAAVLAFALGTSACSTIDSAYDDVIGSDTAAPPADANGFPPDTAPAATSDNGTAPALAEAAAARPLTDVAGRADLRELALVTIDDSDARDFDDAVYCEPNAKGFRLVVAIADVSHYVQPRDALDTEGYNRGNSVYFPRRVIPMLPEALSNGLCSLNPEVDRLSMVCDMRITTAGSIKEYRFYPAVIYSHARLTYNQVWDWLSGAAKPEKKHAALMPHLEALDKLFRTLLKARAKRGAIDFGSTETQIIFDDHGKIKEIVPVVRNDAHRIIEECMLAANVCASDYLHENKQPALFRVHEGPTPEKLAALRGFLAEFGLDLGGGDKPHAKDYAALLEKIKDRPDHGLLQTVMLRSLRQAIYSPDNKGHFGLAYEAYTHFTSPIRRYPDLLVHRGIKAVLNGEKVPAKGLAEIGTHCSMTERRADDATRDVDAWLKTYFMQDRIGDEYNGTVSAVTSFGMFVAIDEIFIEGLVHVSELGQDYFHYDQAKHMMLGERTGKKYRLGDRVRIKVMRADIETSKIDFSLVTEIEPVQEETAAPERQEPALPAARSLGKNEERISFFPDQARRPGDPRPRLRLRAGAAAAAHPPGRQRGGEDAGAHGVVPARGAAALPGRDARALRARARVPGALVLHADPQVGLPLVSRSRAQRAARFVAAMWDDGCTCFMAGTGDDGVSTILPVN